MQKLDADHPVSSTHPIAIRCRAADVTTGNVTLGAGNLVIPVSGAIAADASGVAGTIAISADYIYFCVAADTWKRAALTGGY